MPREQRSAVDIVNERRRKARERVALQRLRARRPAQGADDQGWVQDILLPAAAANPVAPVQVQEEAEEEDTFQGEIVLGEGGDDHYTPPLDNELDEMEEDNPASEPSEVENYSPPSEHAEWDMVDNIFDALIEHMPPPRHDVRDVGDTWEFEEERLGAGEDEIFKLQLGAFLVRLACGPGVSKRALQEIYKFFTTKAEDICRLKMRGLLARGSRTIREKAMKEVSPTVTTKVFRILQGAPHLLGTVTVMTREMQKAKVAMRDSKILLKDLIGHVFHVHQVDIRSVPDVWRLVEISSDGVSVSKAGSWEYHVISVRFINCGTPYLWQIHQVNKSRGGKIDMETIYRPIVQELNEVGFLKVVRFAMDSKERKRALGMTTCNAYYGCSVCETSGMKIPGDKKKRVSYPSTMPTARLRTVERIIKQAQLYRRRLQMLRPTMKNLRDSMWRSKGVTRLSPLLDLANFNLLNGTPGDFMHMAAMGIAKKICRLLFQERHQHLEPGEEKDAVKGRMEAQAKKVDKFLSRQRIPTEMGRRSREMLPAKFKASEWRNFCLLFFLHVGLTILEGGDGARRKIPILFFFLCRLLYSGDTKYKRVDGGRPSPREIMARLQKYYELSFGKGEITFNEHLFMAHALDQRETHGPSTNYSVFRYEDLYGKMKNSFVSGTPNEAKQCFESLYASDYFFHHCRDKLRLKISKKRTERSDDSIVTVGDRFYKVDMVEDGRIVCNEIKKTPLRLCGIDIDDLPWGDVGVYLLGEKEETQVEINLADVDGKGIIVGKHIMSVEKSWLME